MNGGESTLAAVGRLGRAQFGQTVRGAARRIGWDRPDALALRSITFPDSAVATAALCRWGQLTWRIKCSPNPE